MDSTLPQVQGSAPYLGDFPDSLPSSLANGLEGTIQGTIEDADGGEVYPVVTGGDVPPDLGAATLAGVGDVEIVGHVERLAGYTTSQSFVMVPTESWEAAGRAYPLGNTTLVSVTEDADRIAVAEAIEQELPGAQVTTPDAQLESFRSSPVAAGLMTMASASVVLSAMLTALAVVLLVLIGAPERRRLLSILRTMGLAPRQGRQMVLWEILPVIAATTVAGAATGGATAWLLSKAVDLRAMTGGDVAPALALDPLLLSAVVGGVLIVVLATTTGAAAIATRANITDTLRIGEEN